MLLVSKILEMKKVCGRNDDDTDAEGALAGKSSNLPNNKIYLKTSSFDGLPGFRIVKPNYFDFFSIGTFLQK